MFRLNIPLVTSKRFRSCIPDTRFLRDRDVHAEAGYIAGILLLTRILQGFKRPFLGISLPAVPGLR